MLASKWKYMVTHHPLASLVRCFEKLSFEDEFGGGPKLIYQLEDCKNLYYVSSSTYLVFWKVFWQWRRWNLVLKFMIHSLPHFAPSCILWNIALYFIIHLPLALVVTQTRKYGTLFHYPYSHSTPTWRLAILILIIDDLPSLCSVGVCHDANDERCHPFMVHYCSSHCL